MGSFVGIFVGALVWGYVLSAMFNVLQKLDPHRDGFERDMDQVQWLMKDHKLPPSLRQDIRSYCMASEDLWKFQENAKLIAKMSPALRGRITLALAGGDWIQHVP